MNKSVKNNRKGAHQYSIKYKVSLLQHILIYDVRLDIPLKLYTIGNVYPGALVLTMAFHREKMLPGQAISNGRIINAEVLMNPISVNKNFLE